MGFGENTGGDTSDISLKTAYFSHCKSLYRDSLGLVDWEIRATNLWEMTSAIGLVRKYLINRGIEKKSKILDVGSGLGGFVYQALKAGYNAVGLEISPTLVKLSRKRVEELGLENCIIEGSAESLPLVDNSFDLIYSFSVLEHLPNPKLALSEMIRVLKPGGRLILSHANYLSFHERHYKIRWFPMLPKIFGKFYLKCFLNRNTDFLINHITYTNFISTQRWLAQMPVSIVNGQLSKELPARYKKNELVKNISCNRVTKKLLNMIVLNVRFIQSVLKANNSWEIVKND